MLPIVCVIAVVCSVSCAFSGALADGLSTSLPWPRYRHFNLIYACCSCHMPTNKDVWLAAQVTTKMDGGTGQHAASVHPTRGPYNPCTLSIFSFECEHRRNKLYTAASIALLPKRLLSRLQSTSVQAGLLHAYHGYQTSSRKKAAWSASLTMLY